MNVISADQSQTIIATEFARIAYKIATVCYFNKKKKTRENRFYFQLFIFNSI